MSYQQEGDYFDHTEPLTTYEASLPSFQGKIIHTFSRLLENKYKNQIPVIEALLKSETEEQLELDFDSLVKEAVSKTKPPGLKHSCKVTCSVDREQKARDKLKKKLAQKSK